MCSHAKLVMLDVDARSDANFLEPVVAITFECCVGAGCG